MHVASAQVNGNPNIGLYVFATDKYCVVGPEAENLVPLIEQVLKVPVIITTIAGTSLCGVFLAGTSEKLIVPEITYSQEINKLSEVVDVSVFHTVNTALGNLMVVNDKGAIISPVFSYKEVELLSQLLQVDVIQAKIAGLEVIGSCVVSNNKGALIHNEASVFEQDMVLDALKLTSLDLGTVSLGSPYVRSGIITNSNGFIISSNSGGAEITNADRALGFIQ